ncbi:MAG TPA: hypothetical protein PKY31_08550 [Spirochaetota bacterium]|nr:hypothetical protein [Spirochaetota bacterium]
MYSSIKSDPFKALFAFVLLLSCAVPQERPGAGGAVPGDAKVLPVPGKGSADAGEAHGALHVYRHGAELYYLKGCAGGGPCSAVFRDSGGASHEVSVDSQLKGKSLRRFLGAGGVIYLLACEGVAPEAPCLLHRLELNSMKENRVEGVRDIILHEGRPVLLERTDSGARINRNGATVPITIGGSPVFRGFFESRFAVVTNGTDSEMVDLALLRSVYAWSAGRAYKTAGDHNLVVEAMDAGGAPAERMLFYKVFVNGTYSGRTTTGPAQQARRVSLKVEADEHHIVRLERWELPAGKDEYSRVNNIGQPQPLRVYVPRNRVIRLELTREDGRYRATSAAERE